jgi:hypothetical protein
MGIRPVLVIVVAAALLGGCGGTGSSGGDAVTPSSPSSPGSSPSLPSTSSPPLPSSPPSLPEDLPVPPPSGKPSGSGPMEISGTVVEGVEMGCRLIGKYLLMPGPGINGEDLRVGATLTVRGRVERGMMTTCQQGTPFVVTEIVSR